ncbi:MAG: sodium-independent anion transporter [Actinobacteria bacterium]|nr:sodium-independent anion transporter [Actinomycetota bacterium]MSX71852.1 sodium-independent anion transporter [Actinomycetota bacterium]MSY69143.1 sodium-independent anion transporter [Actinomycetota bacterium]MTA76468.1 sodium-independent anion transporter [Actinomycetota bacterium]
MFFSFWPLRSEFSSHRKDLITDLIAGLTVAIVALPLAIGFGITSGMSAAAGLTTAIIAGFLAAVFGGSKYQVSGPTGAMTVILIPVIHNYGVSAVPALGLMAGAMVIMMAIFKLGAVINRVPWTVVEGFTVGIALIISLQQIPLAFGIPKGAGEKSYIVAWNTLINALQAGLNYSSLLVVLITLLIKFSWPHLVHRLKWKFHIPASFVALLLVTLLVKAFAINVATIGTIPRSLGTYQKPIFVNVTSLLIPALWIALLAAVESLLSARVADGLAHNKDHFEPNRELFGQGLATLAASIFGGMPATGAIARTSVNVRSHAQSRLASVFHALVLLVIALIAAPLVSAIPTAVIAGLLLGTSYRILNPVSIMESLRTTKAEASTLVVTAISTVAIDLIWGMAIGIALHMILAHYSKKA